MKDGFEISLEYIHELYQLKGCLKDKHSKEQREKIRSLREVMNKTENKLKYILGQKGFEALRRKIFRYQQLSNKNRFDFTRAEERELEKLSDNIKIRVFEKFYGLSNVIHSFEKRYLFPVENNPFLPNFSIYPDFIDEMARLRLDPLKFIFNVWHRFLKKGEYGNIKLIKKKLFQFKERTIETDKKYLFDSLDYSTNFESLRKKSLYRGNRRDKRFAVMNELMDFIYKKSFLEKTSSFK